MIWDETRREAFKCWNLVRLILEIKAHQIPTLKCFSSRLAVVFAQFIETKCSVENEVLSVIQLMIYANDLKISIRPVIILRIWFTISLMKNCLRIPNYQTPGTNVIQNIFYVPLLRFWLTTTGLIKHTEGIVCILLVTCARSKSFLTKTTRRYVTGPK